MAISKKAHPTTLPDGISKDDLEQKTLRTRDDIQLYYEVIGEGDKTMVLANGLGGRLYSWASIIRAFQDDYRFITWDYRGLFESDAPERIRRLSIVDHAEDLKEILNETGSDSAVIVGWSMGVQVGLEFATLYPKVPNSLILLNGSYGHIFSSGFQPLFRLPYMEYFLHTLLEWAWRHPNVTDMLGNWVTNNLDFLIKFQMALSPVADNREEMQNAMRQYLTDIFSTDFQNYLRLFQELDAHSVYHMLPHIDTPALVISGGLDLLTPAYESREIARRMPNAVHRNLMFANHFALLEYPERVVQEMKKFFDKQPELTV